MNPKKVLFVTRDKKPGMIAVKIADELWCRGHEFAIVAEGPSVAEWKKIGFDDGIIAEGPMDIKEPWDIPSRDVLFNAAPHVVVCGLSSPIRSEEWFAACARTYDVTGSGHGIPLVFLDDNWGAIHRCEYPADLVLTIDALGKRLVHQSLLYAKHRDDQVVIIGDLSATAVQEPIPQATIDAFNAAKGDAEYAFILCSQKWPESDDIVDIGLASCALSLKAGTKLVVIPRFHPGAKPEDKDRWNEKIGLFIREYPEAVQTIDGHNTDHLAALADGVFAATGSALRAAAYAGKFPICVWTSRLVTKLRAESGMENHPLFIAQAAMQITGGVDAALLLKKHGDRVKKNQRELLTPPVLFDVMAAADAILAVAK